MFCCSQDAFNIVDFISMRNVHHIWTFSMACFINELTVVQLVKRPNAKFEGLRLDFSSRTQMYWLAITFNDLRNRELIAIDKKCWRILHGSKAVFRRRVSAQNVSLSKFGLILYLHQKNCLLVGNGHVEAISPASRKASCVTSPNDPPPRRVCCCSLNIREYEVDSCFPTIHGCCKKFDETTCHVIWIWIRYKVKCFVEHKYFEWFIVFLIAASSIALVSEIFLMRNIETLTSLLNSDQIMLKQRMV